MPLPAPQLLQLVPSAIVPGAVLAPDGTAVGLVGGGAPAWDLRAPREQEALADRYHRLLLALDTPLTILLCDRPLALDAVCLDVQQRQARATHPAHAGVLAAVGMTLDHHAQQLSGAKQVVWAITPTATTSAGTDFVPAALVRRLTKRAPVPPADDRTTFTAADRRALDGAVAAARRLVSLLADLDGARAASLLTPAQIARLCAQQLDPVRAARFPLTDDLLARVRVVVTAPV